MKIALAQFDARLGDVEGVCDRIAEQARLAAEQGASLVCCPAPLLSGVLPGSLVESQAFVGDVLRALGDLAARLPATVLVPMAVSFQGMPLFEVVMLKEGRVIPMRTAVAMHNGAMQEEAWVPPVFDVDGVRVGVTFDAARDAERMPSGCDLVLFFQVNGFDRTCEETAAVASVRDGKFRDICERSGMWLACMSPVGSFDEAVYTGGSFVMDDAGRVVASAPCFEEGLCVCEVRRGCDVPAVPDQDLPQWDWEEWLWEALRLYLRDTAHALGSRRAAVLLEGDLPSSLAVALAVDALGSRNVTGVLVERAEIFTPAQEAAEAERLAAVRALADNLHIELVEAGAPSPAALLDVESLSSSAQAGDLVRAAERLVLADVAARRSAVRVCSLTKTDYALVGPGPVLASPGDVAPFGDVFLTDLEYVARYRMRMSPVVPGSLLGLAQVNRRMGEALARVNRAFQELPSYGERVSRLLGALDGYGVDGVLAAHVERNEGADGPGMPANVPPEAVRLLLLHVRRGEAQRRVLPAPPIVSARSFAERAWPQSLAWSDVGRTAAEGGGDPTFESLAEREIERFRELAPDVHARAREEVLGLLGGLLGLSEEEQEELASEEGQRRVREQMERFEEELRRALGAAAGEGQGLPFGQMPPGMGAGQPFFSQN